jgi:hypothetical protein
MGCFDRVLPRLPDWLYVLAFDQKTRAWPGRQAARGL